MAEEKDFVKARDYAYRLLSYRQRSVKEIKERLQRKGYSPKVIKKTVTYLSQLNYLNDENFANSWIQWKIGANPTGCLLLRYQLRQKGINEELLDKVFSDLAKRYDQDKAARQIVSSRSKQYKNIKSDKRKKRLYDYLCRRGFSQEAIVQALGEISEDR